MKRLLSTILVVALAVTMVTSCNKATPTTSTSTSSVSSSASVAAKTWEGLGLKHPLQDVRVRQALAYAIDMNSIIANVFKGNAVKAKSLTSPGEWLDTGLVSYDFNVEKAKALLKEAGWPAAYTLDVVYYYTDQQTIDLMAVIGQYWQAVGVKAQFRLLTGDLNSQLWVTPTDKTNGPSAIKWDMAYAAVAALTESEFYTRFKSTATNNSTLPLQTGLDALIDKISATTDSKQQIAAVKEVQKVMNTNEYQIPLYHQVAFIFTSDKLDMVGNKVGNDQYSYQKNILDWKINRPDNTMYTSSGPTEFFMMTSLNPGLSLDQELLFDKLINSDTNLIPTDGMLAKTFAYSTDQLTLDITMRDEAKWHDGKPVTADDVKFTMELYMKVPGANSIMTGAFGAIKGAKEYVAGTAEHISGIVVTGNTLKITLDKVSPDLLMILSQWPILPSHLLTLKDAATFQQNKFWQKPVGSGPYKVGTFVPSNYTTLVRWDGYYKKGTGNINTIYMFAGGDNDLNTLKNMEGGKIDYAWNKSTDDAAAAAKISFMKVTQANIRYTRFFFINQYPHEAAIK